MRMFEECIDRKCIFKKTKIKNISNNTKISFQKTMKIKILKKEILFALKIINIHSMNKPHETFATCIITEMVITY